MGGGKQRKETMERQSALSKQQEDLGNYFMARSKEDLAQRKFLLDPVISRYTKLASGDPTQIMAASAPELGNLEQQARQARANIMEMAPGAARSAALGQSERELAARRSTILNQNYLSAFPALQGISTDFANTGLQQAGAGYRGVEGAATSNKQIMDTQQQLKASQLGLIGSLAGAAGRAVGGIGDGGGLMSLFKKKPGGGVSTPSGSYPAEPDVGSMSDSFMPSVSMATPYRNLVTGQGGGSAFPFAVNPTAGWFPAPAPQSFQVPSFFNYQTPQLPTTTSSFFSYGK